MGVIIHIGILLSRFTHTTLGALVIRNSNMVSVLQTSWNNLEHINEELNTYVTVEGKKYSVVITGMIDELFN